jgi:hypothetical protein
MTCLASWIKFADLLKDGLVGGIIRGRNDSETNGSMLFDVAFCDTCDHGDVVVGYALG